MSDLARFEEFLGTLDMDDLRDKYSKIRIVELNLPKKIQAIGHLVSLYWEERESWPGYDEFYGIYAGDKADVLSEFRKDTQFSEESFNRGLPARTYRTWAALLTQIQCGYLAEDVFGTGNVKITEKLDQRFGVDVRIMKGNETIDLQIKKVTKAGVKGVRPAGKGGKAHAIEYEVPGSRYTLKGTERVPYTRWKDTYQGKLDVLENGFVVFREGIFDKWR